jgi:pimeloyl-ACP methyl ester carboxylesterase
MGQGPPLVLVHGWSASIRTNWEGFGWLDFLKQSHRLLLVDLRGHGRSGKPHRRAEYTVPLLASDVVAAMDHAGFERAIVFGYSTGAEVATRLLLDYPGRFYAAVLGGIGTEFHFGWGRRFDREDGKPRPTIDWFPPRCIGGLASWVTSDLLALAVAFLGLYGNHPAPVPVDRLGEIRVPVLTVVGTRDGFCRSSRDLAGRIAGCERVTISGRNHATTLGDRRFKAVVADFLARLAPDGE